KAIMDVEVFREGVLSGPIAPVGSVVAVGAPMAYLVASADQVVRDSVQAAPAAPAAKAPAAKTVSQAHQPSVSSAPATTSVTVASSGAEPASRPQGKAVTPYARKLAT